MNDSTGPTPKPPDGGGEDITIEFVDHDDSGEPVSADASVGPFEVVPADEGVLSIEVEQEAGGQDEGPAGPDAALAEKVAKLEDRLLRLRAEFENYKRRVARDQEEYYRQAVARTVQGLLPVMDSLELAAAALEADAPDHHVQGLSLVIQQFGDALAGLGLEEVEALGQPFDPALHEAMAMAAREDLPPMTVSRVFSRGYLLGGKVVRPAKVEVTSAPADGAPGRSDG